MCSAEVHHPTLLESASFCDPALEAFDARHNSHGAFNTGFATPSSMQSSHSHYSPPREFPLFDQHSMSSYGHHDPPPLQTEFTRQMSQGPDFRHTTDTSHPSLSAIAERTASPEPIADPWATPWGPAIQQSLQPPLRKDSQSQQSPGSSPRINYSPRGSTSSSSNKGSHNRELDRLLWQLKRDIPDMSWNAIASNIQACLGEVHQVPALQMRYKRLRERRQKRTATENNALLAALKHYEENKWTIIAERMNNAGLDGTWSPEWCEKRWLSLELDRVSSVQVQGQTPVQPQVPAKPPNPGEQG